MHVPCPGPWAALGAPTCQGHWAPRTALGTADRTAVFQRRPPEQLLGQGLGRGPGGRGVGTGPDVHGRGSRPSTPFPTPCAWAPEGPTWSHPFTSTRESRPGHCPATSAARCLLRVRGCEVGQPSHHQPPPPPPLGQCRPPGDEGPCSLRGRGGLEGVGGPSPPCPALPAQWVCGCWGAAPLLPRGERGSASPAEGAPVPRGPAGGGAGPDRRAPWAVVTAATTTDPLLSQPEGVVSMVRRVHAAATSGSPRRAACGRRQHSQQFPSSPHPTGTPHPQQTRSLGALEALPGEQLRASARSPGTGQRGQGSEGKWGGQRGCLQLSSSGHRRGARGCGEEWASGRGWRSLLLRPPASAGPSSGADLSHTSSTQCVL